MKLKIVKINKEDGMGVPLNVRAWKYSRNNDETSFKDVMELDLPVNEIPSIVVEIESTIIEREVLTSMRDHSMWARTSRVDDAINFKIPLILEKHIKYKEYADHAHGRMIQDKSKGARQDEYRLHMPLFALTRYTMSINLRSLVIIQKYFSHLKISAQDIGLKELYHDAAGAFKFMIEQFTSDSSFLIGIKYKEILPRVEKIQNGRISDFITFSGSIPFSLRTHLIRHRMIFMNDKLKEIATHSEFHTFNLKTEMSVSITSNVGFWTDIVAKRSCWLVHYSMWEQIIKVIFKFLPEPELGEEILPCNGNGKSCCYEEDVKSRLQNKDPNPPCPIYLAANEIPVSKEMKQQISKQFVLDHRPIFWTKSIGEIK